MIARKVGEDHTFAFACTRPRDGKGVAVVIEAVKAPVTSPTDDDCGGAIGPFLDTFSMA